MLNQPFSTFFWPQALKSSSQVPPHTCPRKQVHNMQINIKSPSQSSQYVVPFQCAQTSQGAICPIEHGCKLSFIIRVCPQLLSFCGLHTQSPPPAIDTQSSQVSPDCKEPLLCYLTDSSCGQTLTMKPSFNALYYYIYVLYIIIYILYYTWVPDIIYSSGSHPFSTGTHF